MLIKKYDSQVGMCECESTRWTLGNDQISLPANWSTGTRTIRGSLLICVAIFLGKKLRTMPNLLDCLAENNGFLFGIC